MFNFAEFENVTNKQIQTADVKVFAGNKIRLGEDAAKKLGLNGEKTLVITRNPNTNQVAIYSTSQEGLGRSVNKKNEFSNGSIAHILGGQHSEWAITGDGVTNPATNDVWFELKETVNGAAEKARLAALANENGELVVQSEDLKEEASEEVEEAGDPISEEVGSTFDAITQHSDASAE